MICAIAEPPAMQRTVEERNAIVEQNLGLAYAAAIRWIRSYPDAARALGERDDVVQLALLELVQAAERWNPAKASFGTFATICIRYKLSTAAGNSGMIRIPLYVTGEEREELRERLIPRSADAMSFGQDGDLFELAAPEPEERDPDPEGRMAAVNEALRRLPCRRRYVLLRRASGARLQDVAAELGVTKERVRQLERDGLRRVRRTLGVEAKRGGFGVAGRRGAARADGK